MKARLLDRDKDFNPAALPWNADALAADLELATLLEAMAQGDAIVSAVSSAHGISRSAGTTRCGGSSRPRIASTRSAAVSGGG